MKARVKNTGEIIEVERITNTTYGRLDVAQIYRKDMLDFDLSEPEEEVTVEGWVCRDKEFDKDQFASDLFLSMEYPKRNNWSNTWIEMGAYIPLNTELFPSVTWESDPQKVEIIIKLKKK